MKNLNKLFTRILPLVLLVTLFSCSGSDDEGKTNSSDKFVGTWKYIGDTEGVEQTFVPNTEECYSVLLTINGNGKGNAKDTYCDGTNDNLNFTWKKESQPNVYTTLDEDGTDPDVLFIVFEGNKMTITDGVDPDGEVFQRQ